jgi:hypothetical protein
MARPPLEVADVIRAHRDDYLAAREGRVSALERRLLDDLAACRTAARGGHVQQCAQCGRLQIAYNSCRNRHCPKCQQLKRAEWLADRQAELLPVEYFHVVFSVPHELAALALPNKEVVYEILFRAVAETLRTIAADPKHLGAEIGFVAVLHTWGQRLDHHPHLHCVVPGGGLAPDGSRWIACRQGFFLPVRVLASLFRGKFLAHLQRAFDTGQLVFPGDLIRLESFAAFRSLRRRLTRKKWVVYSQPPFGGPERVLAYLARYTHRVAISNQRLVALKDGTVSFTWKDYRRDSRRGVMTLDAVEFLRRFLLHALPAGFMRIRHYGFLANRGRREKLERCRQLLPATPPPRPTEPTTPRDQRLHCPHCRSGTMICVLTFGPGQRPAFIPVSPSLDTS